MPADKRPALRHPPGTPVFDWSTATDLELLVDGATFYPHVFTHITTAVQRVWIELYLVESGHICAHLITALVAAKQRGLEVRLLIDGLGAQGMSHADRRHLSEAGVDLRVYNPPDWRHPLRSLLRDHRKILIIDDLAYTGGAGISDDFAQSSPAPWRETMVAMRGDIVAQWCCLFDSVWQGQPTLAPIPISRAGTFSARVNASQADLPQHLQASLLRAMAHARQRIWIATPYFLPPRRLRKALRQAARRGVDVRLLIPGRHNDHPLIGLLSHSFLARLGAHGVKTYQYRPRFLHTKVYLCDQWCSLGSSNMDRWGMFWNLEANLEVDSAEFSDRIVAMLTTDFAAAERLPAAALSAWHRLLQRCTHLIINLLERWRKR